MNFFILILLVGLFIFLFCIYFLSRDDLVFLQKDIMIEKIFNLSFIDFIVGIFFARFFYVIFYNLSILKNPFVFILFPYFPGLSLGGGVLGASVFMLIYSKTKNIPVGRIFDFFSISFLAALPIGTLGYFWLSGEKLLRPSPIALIFIYIILFFIFFKFLFGLIQKGKLKDGTVGLLFLISLSLISIIFSIIDKFKGFLFLKDPENLIFLGMFLIPLVLLVKHEKLIRIIKSRPKLWI